MQPIILIAVWYSGVWCSAVVVNLGGVQGNRLKITDRVVASCAIFRANKNPFSAGGGSLSCAIRNSYYSEMQKVLKI